MPERTRALSLRVPRQEVERQPPATWWQSTLDMHGDDRRRMLKGIGLRRPLETDEEPLFHSR